MAKREQVVAEGLKNQQLEQSTEERLEQTRKILSKKMAQLAELEG